MGVDESYGRMASVAVGVNFFGDSEEHFVVLIVQYLGVTAGIEPAVYTWLFSPLNYNSEPQWFP
jgi:hypothetical protein